MTEIIEIVLLMATTGIVAGLLSGLFGVGGGIIMVPVLDYALMFSDLPAEFRMHAAVATSLSIVVFTSTSSSYSHYLKSALDFELISKWWIYLLSGSVLGIAIASISNSSVLAIIFGIMTLIIAIKMLLPYDSLVLHDGIPKSRLCGFIPLAVGSLSSIMGIGGGTLGVPTLTLLNFPIHKAVGTAAFFGVLISIPGSIGYIIIGMQNHNLPYGFLGYVSIIGLITISPIAMLVAPFGAQVAHNLEGKTLKRLFGCFLLLVSIRMIYRVLQS